MIRGTGKTKDKDKQSRNIFLVILSEYSEFKQGNYV